MAPSDLAESVDNRPEVLGHHNNLCYMNAYSQSTIVEIAELLSLLDGSEDKQEIIAYDLLSRYQLSIEEAWKIVDGTHDFFAERSR